MVMYIDDPFLIGGNGMTTSSAARPTKPCAVSMAMTWLGPVREMTSCSAAMAMIGWTAARATTRSSASVAPTS